MSTVAAETLVPRRLKMSYQEYLDFAPESKIVEWVAGEAIIYMPPQYQHQNISSFLNGLLRSFTQFFGLGSVVIAPFEVNLWPNGPAREPDIFFVAAENQAKLTEKRYEGGPDLIIEIISPSSVTEDRVHKFTEYEQAGVREYWLIDPRHHQQQADFFVLGEDGAFRPAPVDEDGIYHSTVISNFWLNIDWLWREELPNPQLALAEIIISIESLPAEVRETYQAMYELLADQS